MTKLFNHGAIMAMIATILLGREAAAQSGPYQFHTLTPCRVVHTRRAPGPTGGPALNGGQTRSFPALGICGIPTSAKALAANVTIVKPSVSGHVSVFPAGTAVPNVSTVNFEAGDDAVANGAIVPVSEGNVQFSAYLVGVGATAHFLFDVVGYFD